MTKKNKDVVIKILRTDDNFEISDGKHIFVKEKSPMLKIPHFSLVTGLPPCTAHSLFSKGFISSAEIYFTF